MTTFAGSAPGSSAPSVFEFDLVAYLGDALQMQIYAPLKRGQRYRGPVNTTGPGPFVAYANITEERDPLLAGPSGIVEATYQIDVFSEVQDDCLVIAEQIRWALDGFSGPMGATDVLSINLVDRNSGWLENEDPKKVGVYRRISEFKIFYVEPVRDFSAP